MRGDRELRPTTGRRREGPSGSRRGEMGEREGESERGRLKEIGGERRERESARGRARAERTNEREGGGGGWGGGATGQCLVRWASPESPSTMGTPCAHFLSTLRCNDDLHQNGSVLYRIKVEGKGRGSPMPPGREGRHPPKPTLCPPPNHHTQRATPTDPGGGSQPSSRLPRSQSRLAG